MKTIRNWLIACTILSSQAVAGAAQLEALDPGFGDQGDGRQVIGFPNGYSAAYAVATDTEGRLLLAGDAYDQEQSQRGAVIRLRADGTIDPTFAHELTPLPAGVSAVYWNAVSAAADGGVIAGGAAQLPDALIGIVCRLDSEGKYDQSFGRIETPGCVTLENEDASAIILAAIATQSDGSVVLAGTAYSQDATAAARLWRLTPTGQLDSGFGNQGAAQLPDDYYLKSAFAALDVAEDDSIAAAGSYGSSGDSAQMLVARFTPDGDPMTEFSGGDRVIPFTHLPFDQRMSSASSVHIADNGSVIVGGFARTADINGTNNRPALVKLDSHGNGVESFGMPGLASGQRIVEACRTPPCTFSPRMMSARDGKIVIAGSVTYSQFAIKQAFAMVLTPTGEIDPSFADSDGTFAPGVATAWWPEAYAFGAAALQGKKVVLAGSVKDGDETKFAAIRFRSGILFSDGFGDN